MKTLKIFFLGLAIASQSFGSSDIDTVFYPHKMLDPDYNCYETNSSCNIPSLALLQAYSASFESRVQALTDKVHGLVDQQEAEADRLEAIAQSYTPYPRSAEIARTLANRLHSENKLALDSLNEAFDLSRQELENLTKAVTRLQTLLKAGSYDIQQFRESVIKEKNRLSSGKDARESVERLLATNGSYNYSLRIQDIFKRFDLLGEGRVFSSRKFVEGNPEDSFILDEDADVIDHLLNVDHPFHIVEKKYPYGTPDFVMEAGTKYNPKTNQFVCTSKRVDLISWENHAEMSCPGGLKEISFLKTQIRKFLSSRKN